MFAGLLIQIEKKVWHDPETGLYVSHCYPLDVCSQGDTEEEAANNLNEAVQIFLSTCYEMGTLNAVLKECGLNPEELLRFLELNGWQRHGQEGSHVKMTKAGALRPIIVPVGTREVSQHVLRTNLATAQITVAEYRRLTERK